MWSSSISRTPSGKCITPSYVFSLDHHHIPPDITNLIMSQYTGFFLNVMAPKSGLRTGPIDAQRGVLQRDTLSPLFNIVLDSLMSTLSDPHIQSHGVLWRDSFTRSLWTQFADDAAVVCDNL